MQRRNFFKSISGIGKRSIVLILLFATILFAQVVINRIPIWSNGHVLFPTLGQSLRITNDTLDVVFPTTSQITRRYGLQLNLNPISNTYLFPLGATNIVVFHNGIRNLINIDYQIESNGIRMLFAATDAQISIDFDEIRP
jgi:hypothetical protein